VSREGEEYSLLFVRTWAEAVLRQVQRVHEVRHKAAVDDRNYERMEDWSPLEAELEANFRQLWAEEHTLIWAAFQLERWTRRLQAERRAFGYAEDKVLQRVRNVLEHLDAADFQGGRAVAKAGDNEARALQKLGGLTIGLTFAGQSFGLIDPDELEEHALAAVKRIEDELDQAAKDWVEGYLSGIERPK
jgi:hypothetical protein